jgi:hypothetical protein
MFAANGLNPFLAHIWTFSWICVCSLMKVDRQFGTQLFGLSREIATIRE